MKNYQTAYNTAILQELLDTEFQKCMTLNEKLNQTKQENLHVLLQMSL